MGSLWCRHTVLATALAGLLAPAASAQVQFGFGGDDPIEVRAQTATYKGGLTVLETDVVATQNDTSVAADRMDIYREEAGEGEAAPTIAGSIRLGALQRIEARGNFRFENPENTVTGNEGIYYADREVIIVTGNVVLTQPGGTSVQGNRLVYNTATGTARFGDPCETDTARAGECARVTFELK